MDAAVLTTGEVPQVPRRRSSPSWKTIGGVVLLVVLVGVIVAIILVSTVGAKRPPLADDIHVDNIIKHLRELDAIAAAHEGARTEWSGGYNSSAAYIESVLSQYAKNQITVSRVPFTGEVLTIFQPPQLRVVTPEACSFVYGTDFFTSASPPFAIRASMALKHVARFGCHAEDYAGLRNATEPGVLGFVESVEGCTAREKAEAAASARMLGLMVRLGPTDIPPYITEEALKNPLPIPVFFLRHAVAAQMRGNLGNLSVMASFGYEFVTIGSFNLVAETRAGNPNATVVFGAHLDSTPNGPGINDNGSGSAGVLEVFIAAAKAGLLKKPANKVKFIWWGLEEFGLLGSIAYVKALSAAETNDHVALFNADMLGSPNWVLGVGDPASAPEHSAAGFQVLYNMVSEYFNKTGQVFGVTPLIAGSDMAPFTVQNIPSTFVVTGAGGSKSMQERAAFGGMAGAAYDGCYHDECDTTENTAAKPLEICTKCMAHMLEKLIKQKDLRALMRPTLSDNAPRTVSSAAQERLAEIRFQKAMELATHRKGVGK